MVPTYEAGTTMKSRIVKRSIVLAGRKTSMIQYFRNRLWRGETDFAYRLDRWDTYGGNIIQHIAIIDDLELAMAAYEAACKRWPGETITLRQGARIIKATRV
jgi:hypothetical protein